LVSLEKKLRFVNFDLDPAYNFVKQDNISEKQ